MSTLGGMISYANRKRFTSSSKTEKRLPREEWEKKLRAEGKWIDYKKKKD
jgi:hypothetical protein